MKWECEEGEREGELNVYLNVDDKNEREKKVLYTLASIKRESKTDRKLENVSSQYQITT